MLKINKVVPRVFEGFKVFDGLGIRKAVRLLLLPTLLLASLPALQAATLNVLDYGAVINDGLDDSAAINRAFNAASSGDEVYFPNGTYNIFTQLTVPANVTVRGESENGVILVSNTTTSADHMFYAYPAGNVHIQQLTIDGNSNPYLSIGISLRLGQNSSIDHVKIQNMAVTDYGTGVTPVGIMFIFMDYSSITNNTMLNIGVNDRWGSGIRVWNSSTHIYIAYNYIQDTGVGGILCNDYSTDLTVEYNTVRGSGHYSADDFGLSIEVQDNCPRSLVQYNDVDHWISVGGNFSHHAVRGNTVSDTAVWKPYGLEDGGTDFVCSRNRVLSGSKIGILAGSSTGGLYRDNEIRHCNTLGLQMLYVNQSCFYRNILDGTVRDTQSLPGGGHGLMFSYNINKMFLKDNQITNNEIHGIEYNDPLIDQLSFVGNTIANNGGASIVTPFPGNKIEWINNLVYGNGTNNELVSRGGWDLNVPDANFTCPTTVQVNTAIQFTDTSTDTDGTIAARLWDFDAGLPSTDTNPTFTYDRWGHYTPTLVVWDNDGKASVIDKSITVLPDSKDLLLLDLDETDTTSTITDQSEDHNTISTYGTRTIAPGIRNNCLDFLSNFEIHVSGPIVNGKLGDSFRLTAWVRLKSMPTWRCIIFSKEAYLTNGFRAGIDASGGLCFWTTQSGGTLELVSAAGLVQTGRWYLVEYVYANEQANIYLNKTLVASGSGTYIPNNSNILRLGYEGTQQFDGYLDEIEVSSLSLLDLNLNEGSGVPADASEDHNTMVLADGTTWDTNGYQGSCLRMNSGGLYTSGPVVNQLKDPSVWPPGSNLTPCRPGGTAYSARRYT